jgi:hypothetical protein
VHPALDKTKLVDSLHFVTNADAHAAPDAQIHVESDEVGIVVDVEIALFGRERQFTDLVLVDKILKRTIPSRIATRAK